MSRLLCDLFPLVLVTSLSPTYPNCPTGLLPQAQLLPLGPWFLRGPCEDHSAWLPAPEAVAPCVKVTIPSPSLEASPPRAIPPAPHHPHSSYLVPLTVTVICLTAATQKGELRPGRGLAPSASSVPGTRKVCNKHLQIKNQELWESEGRQDMEARAAEGCGAVSECTWRAPLS